MTSRTVSGYHFSLMPVKIQKSIESKENARKASIDAHEILLITTDNDSTAVPKFLDSRTNLLQADIDYQHECLQGLSDIRDASETEIEAERTRVHTALKPLFLEMNVLTRSKRSLSADTTEQLIVKKRRHTPNTEPDGEQLANAYAKSIFMFTMSHSGNKKDEKFDQSQFKKDVIEYYNAEYEVEGEEGYIYCQLTGKPFPKKRVKAAHLVPKCFSDRTLEYLFGSNEKPTRANPCNALLLLSSIEEALDKGKLAIVPIQVESGLPTRWKCIILDNSMRNKMLKQGESPGKHIMYRDVDNKELAFFNDNRPARRFLYFKFMLGLMMAVYNGKKDIVRSLNLDDEVTSFWPSPGEYVRRGTLTTLTRYVSGLQLPESMIKKTTFDDMECTPGEMDRLTETELGLEMREVMVLGSEQRDEENSDEDTDCD